MSTSTKRDAISAALSVAEDLDSGRIDADALDAQLRTEVTALVENVVGPGDEPAWIWELQCAITRSVLAVGGAISADELGEWASVARSREAPGTGRTHPPHKTHTGQRGFGRQRGSGGQYGPSQRVRASAD